MSEDDQSKDSATDEPWKDLISAAISDLEEKRKADQEKLRADLEEKLKAEHAQHVRDLEQKLSDLESELRPLKLAEQPVDPDMDLDEGSSDKSMNHEAVGKTDGKNNSDQNSEGGELQEKTLTEDTFSFMIAAPIKSKPFFMALWVWFLQMIVFVLLALNLMDFANKENPFNIPSNVEGAVRLTQLMALTIAVILQNDLIVFSDLLRDGYSNCLQDAFCYATRAKFTLSSILRFLEGSFCLMLMFALIVSSKTVIDVLLNFTAVEFVSQFDEGFFYLSSQGFLGSHCEKWAETITDTTYSSPKFRLHRRRKMILMLSFFLALMVGWIVVIDKQQKGTFFCSTIMVQFGDDVLPALGTFSGLYDKVVPNSGSFSPGRVEYVDRQSNKAKLVYCEPINAWVFYWEENDSDEQQGDAGQANRYLKRGSGQAAKNIKDSGMAYGDNGGQDACLSWRTRSETTTTFDLLETASVQWYVRDADQREIILEPFFLSCYDCTGSNQDCSGRGTCQNAECNCEDGWFGLQCEFIEPCLFLEPDIRTQNFPSFYEWSASFNLLLDDGGAVVELYNRPVYVGTAHSSNFVDTIFFTGRRWAATYTYYLPDLEGANKSNVSALVDYFEIFHAHWSDFTVLFLSDATDIGRESDSVTPVGLRWSFAKTKSRDQDDIQQMDSTAVATIFLCAICNNNSNPCLYDGQCEDDSTCLCSIGSAGALCEQPPVGNGHCDQFFNIDEFALDGGDCCESTCVSSESFICGTEDDGYTSVGYPHCKLSSNRWHPIGEPMSGEPNSFLVGILPYLQTAICWWSPLQAITTAVFGYMTEMAQCGDCDQSFLAPRMSRIPKVWKVST